MDIILCVGLLLVGWFIGAASGHGIRAAVEKHPEYEFDEIAHADNVVFYDKCRVSEDIVSSKLFIDKMMDELGKGNRTIAYNKESGYDYHLYQFITRKEKANDTGEEVR